MTEEKLKRANFMKKDIKRIDYILDNILIRGGHHSFIKSLKNKIAVSFNFRNR